MRSGPQLPPRGESSPAAPPAVLVEPVAAWCRRRPVELCVLFGSRATGGDRPDSDVDLAVWVVGRKASAEERLAWHRELTRLLGLPVQLVVVGPRLDPVLGLQIARQGHVLHATRDSVWPHERLRLWHLYQDSRPFLAAARHRLRRFAEEPHHGA